MFIFPVKKDSLPDPLVWDILVRTKRTKDRNSASLSCKRLHGLDNEQGERMSRGGTHESSRKALGSIKDTTTVELAKVNSHYKELEIVIFKFTNHVERPTKKKHVRGIFAAISAIRSRRADVAYCIHALARQLSKKHNWVFACSKLPISQMGVEEENGTPGNILPAIEQKMSEELEMKVKKYLRGANLEVLQDKKLKHQLAAREELYGKSAKATAKAEKTS